MHNILQRPRDVPVRTSLGAAFIAFYVLNLINGGNDIFALKLDISLNVMTWVGRIGSFVVPVIIYILDLPHLPRVCSTPTARCSSMASRPGIIKRLPHGEFIEVHQSLGRVDSHGHPIPLAYQGASVPKRMNQLGSAGHAVRGFLKPKDDSGHLDAGHADELGGGDSPIEVGSDGAKSLNR